MNFLPAMPEYNQKAKVICIQGDGVSDRIEKLLAVLNANMEFLEELGLETEVQALWGKLDDIQIEERSEAEDEFYQRQGA